MDNKEKNNNFEIIRSGTITSVPGFYAAACHCGIKKSGKPDICVIYAPDGSVCSGVFTTNKFMAAPVIVAKKQLKKTGNIKAIIINSGIANACTGRKGYINAMETVKTGADYLGISCNNVIVSSTGVVGEQLPMEKIKKGIKQCVSDLSHSGGHSAAEAILTTDLKIKEIAVKIKTDGGKNIVVAGMAKGSGMIEPNMATLLSFITTNIKISKELLDEILKNEIAASFNSITIDGCQSTNDMLLVISNSESGVEINNKNSKFYNNFKDALEYVLKYLARQIVLDGEGATKLIEINVINAKSKSDARKFAFGIANSNLFKTAIFGEDLNWGRINASLGSVSCSLNPEKVDIYLSDILIVKDGIGAGFNGKVTGKLMKEKEIKFTVDLNCGKEKFKVLTADLSFDYIKINALYRT